MNEYQKKNLIVKNGVFELSLFSQSAKKSDLNNPFDEKHIRYATLY